jgi:hypothetical protein
VRTLVLALAMSAGLSSMPAVIRSETAYLDPAAYFRLITPEASNEPLPCGSDDSSCSQEIAMSGLSEPASDGLIHLHSIGPGLRSEARFAEALELLWEWPEGREILATAGQFKTSVRTGSYSSDPTSFASYDSDAHLIRISPAYTEVPTWSLAGLLAHESRHIADAALGIAQAHTASDCFTRETRAYVSQSAFLTWLQQDMNQEIFQRSHMKSLQGPTRTVANLLFGIWSATDKTVMVHDDYRLLCTGS